MPTDPLVVRRRQLRIRRSAAELLLGSADPDGRGLELRGREFQPARSQEFDPLVLEALLRLARLAGSAADALRDHPAAAVRRAAAVLAARGHPLLAAFDD